MGGRSIDVTPFGVCRQEQGSVATRGKTSTALLQCALQRLKHETGVLGPKKPSVRICSELQSHRDDITFYLNKSGNTRLSDKARFTKGKEDYSLLQM